MLKKLHTGVKVHFEVNGVQKVINSTIGGKQGDLLFPDLFNLHICAIMQIWRKRRVGTDVGLRTKRDFVLGTKGNKRDSNYGGKVVGGWWFRKNGCAPENEKHIGYTYDPNNKINEQTNKPKMKITNDTRRRNETDDKETPKPATEEDKARPV